LPCRLQPHTLNDAAGLALYADNNTKFYQAVKTSGTYTSVTAYTGYANVASMSGLTATNTMALDANQDGIADVVFLDNTTLAGVATNYAYVTGSFTSDGTTRTYDVIVNGTASKMALTGVSAAGLYSVASDGTAAAITGTQALVISCWHGRQVHQYHLLQL
jgi:hypothetical protein